MRSVIALFALLVTACSGPSGGGAGAAPRPASGGANLITQDEIAGGGRFSNALEIVQSLRPSMLRPRAAALTTASGSMGTMSNGASSVAVIVFLDQARYGESNTLSQIAANTVKEIRFISASDATTLWGTGYSSGVIQVITRKP